MMTRQSILTVTQPEFVNWDFDGAETARYGLAGLSESRGRVELLLREVIVPKPEDLVRTPTGGSIVVRPGFAWGVYGRGRATGLDAVISVHTHGGRAFVSGIDRESTLKHAQVARDFGLAYAQVVVGKTDIAASLLRDGVEVPIDVVKVIKSRGMELRPTVNGAWRGSELDRAVHDRSLQIGGGIEEALRLMGNLRIGFVGAGGVGAAAISTLRFLNLKRCVIVDPDVLDKSNANRYIGFRAGDIGTAKALVQKRELQSYDPSIQVDVVQEQFPSPAAIEALKPCDLIVCTPDNHWCRLQVAEFAARYLKPVFDAGAGIYVDEAGVPYRISGSTRVQLPPPLGPCLGCAGVRAEHPPHVEAAVEAARKSYVKGYKRSGPTPASVATLITHAGNMVARHILYYLSAVGGDEAKIPLHFTCEEITLRCEDLTGLWSRKIDCPVCGEQARWAHGDAAALLPERPGESVAGNETNMEAVCTEQSQ
jgi:hypothetical protein